MDGSTDFVFPTETSDWLGIDEARAQARDHIMAFVARAAEPDSDPTSAMAMRVSPGVGKTRAALEAIAMHGDALLARGHVIFYMPTTNLADEARDILARLAPDLPAQTFRGRLAKNPTSSKNSHMCSMPDRIKPLIGKVRSIGLAACARVDANGKLDVASCFEGCAYYAQKPRKDEHRVIFLAHAYLGKPKPFSGDPSLIVIDEKIWQERIRIGELPLDRMNIPSCGITSETDRCAFDAAVQVLHLAALRGTDIYKALRKANIAPDELRRFADEEKQNLPEPYILPSMNDGKRSYLADTFDTSRRRALSFRVDLLQAVADAMERQSQRITVEMRNAQEGPRAHLVLHKLNPLNRNAPTLLLDADADRQITGQIAPGAAFVEINVAPCREIIQVTDRSLSPSSIAAREDEGASKSAAPTLTSEIITVIDREVKSARGKVLVVGPKATLKHFPTYRENQEIAGAEGRNLGPSMQGINSYRDSEKVIVLGRLEPPCAAINSMTRALFGDDETPIKCVDQLVWMTGHYAMRDGTYRTARYMGHPDPRAASVLNQIREASTLQAIARLRLTDPSGPKRVILACNVPLPGLLVDEFTSWQGLVNEVPADIANPGKYMLLREALKATQRLRLSRDGLHQDAPTVFRTVNAAAEFRRGLPTSEVIELAKRVAHDLGLEAQIVALGRLGGGGRATPAILIGDTRFEKLWPDMS